MTSYEEPINLNQFATPRTLHISVYDCVFAAQFDLCGEEITMHNAGGTDLLRMLAFEIDSRRPAQITADHILERFCGGYDGDPAANGLTVTIADDPDAAEFLATAHT